MKDAGKKASILLVDDDILISESNKILLRKSGYETAGIACDGKTAIEMALEKKPDLILMDVNLNSEIDGIAAAEEIQKSEDIPVIFVTAYSDPSTIERAKKVGPFGYLIKPFENRELLVSIETSLYKHSFDKKIKEQEFLFRTVANFAYEWEFWIMPDLQFKYCSPSCERVTGYKAEEFINNPKLLFDIIHEDDKSKFEEHFRKYHSENSTETVQALILKIINKNGGVKFIRHTCNPIFSDDNAYIGRRVTNVDITDRTLSDKKLRESEEFLSRVINNIDEIIYSVSFIKNQDASNVDFVSEQVKNILGYHPNDFKKMPGLWFSIIHPEDTEEVARQTKLMFKSKKASKRIYRMKHKVSGEYIWIEDHPQLLFDKEENIIGQFGTARDITESKKADELINESEQRYRLLYENSIDAVMLTKPDGSISSANPAACKMLNMTEDEICSKGREAIADRNDPRLLSMINQREQTGKAFGEITMFRKGGIKFEAEISSSVFIDNSGEKRTSMIIRDISERKEYERQLILSEERLRLATEFANVAVWEYDFNSNSMSRSKNHDGLYGLEWQEHWDINTFLNATHPDDRELSNNTIQGSAVPGGPDSYGFDFRVAYPDKSIHWLAVIGNVVERSKEGHALTVRGTLTDITERKHAEEALKESEERYLKLINTIPSGVAVYQDGEFVFVNHASLEIMNITNKDVLLGKSVLSIVHPDSKNEVMKRMLLVAKGNYVPPFEEKLIRPDGSVFFAEVSAIGTTYKDKPAGLVVVQDITERKKSEEHIKENENKYRLLFENMNEGVAINEIITDSSGKVIDFRFIDANSAYEEHTGHKPKDIIGRTILEVIPNADKHQIETYGKVVQTGEPLKYEYFSESFKKYFRVRALKHSPKRFATIFEDVSEIKEAEELLQLNAKKFNLLTSTTNDGFWIADIEGKIVDVNDVYCEMTGYTRNEILTKYIFDLEENESSEETKQHIKYIIKSGFHRFESRHKCKNGKIINVEVSVNYSSELEQFLVFVHDITQRKIDETELKKTLNEINRFNKLMLGREYKMMDLKHEINLLLEKLGLPQKYKISNEETVD